MTTTNAWVVALLFLFPPISFSAEIASVRSNISIVGRITKGDAETLRNAIRAYRTSMLGTIDLESPGGDVEEATKIADMLKPLLVTIRAMPLKECASACSMIWLVGTPRMAVPAESAQRIANVGLSAAGGIVGLHRPYLVKFDSTTNNQSEVMRRVQGYLEKQMMPRRLVDLMMSRPSNDVYWLNAKDLAELGEYRPDVEEFLISKCGYVRSDRMAALGWSVEKILKLSNCTFDSLAEERVKALANFKKQ